MRALQEINRIQQSTSIPIQWQHRSAYEMGPERWVLTTLHQSDIGATATNLVVYPDIFRGFGIREENEVKREELAGTKSDRWQDQIDDPLDTIASCLPLARALGAIVTPHLHSGVTHVICNIKQDGEFKCFGKRISLLKDFKDVQQGERLMERIEEIYTTKS